jgi:hypothetical protein
MLSPSNPYQQEAALHVSVATALLAVPALQAGTHGQAPAPAQPAFRFGVKPPLVAFEL